MGDWTPKHGKGRDMDRVHDEEKGLLGGKSPRGSLNIGGSSRRSSPLQGHGQIHFGSNPFEESVENKDDKSQLTLFPAPGDPRRQVGGTFVWDGSESDDEMDMGVLLPRSTPGGQDKASLAFPGVDGMPPVNLNLKLYWMPDKLCKVCYECDTPFSMFKRRHHCRVCGQIFCHNCSSHFTDGKDFGINGVLRTCTTCWEQLEATRRARKAERRSHTLISSRSRPRPSTSTHSLSQTRPRLPPRVGPGGASSKDQAALRGKVMAPDTNSTPRGTPRVAPRAGKSNLTSTPPASMARGVGGEDTEDVPLIVSG
ncbi:unnamed protein product, partial [Discosporangium mesarthrocarpum]